MRRLIDFSLTNNLFGIGQWRINSAAKKAIGVSLPTDQHLFHEPKNEIDCKLTFLIHIQFCYIKCDMLYCLQIVFACLLAKAIRGSYHSV